MPLVLIARLVASIVSITVLAAGAYLAWSWWDGTWQAVGDGDLVRVREPWRLTLAGLLLAWSFLGRFVVLALAARPDEPGATRTREPWMVDRLSSPTGSDLHIQKTGPEDAPVLLLTHGWGLDLTIWRALGDTLGRRYRVVAWDLPGLGASKAPAMSAIGLDLFASDLAAILRTIDGPVILTGHSIGGMTIQTLLRDDPDLVRDKVAGLVLLNTTYTNPLKTMALSGLAQAVRAPMLEPSLWATIILSPLAQLSAWQSYFSGAAHLANRVGFASRVTRGQLEHTTLLTTRNSQAVSARGNLAMFRWDATNALALADVPTLVLGGQQDLVTKPEASQVMAATAPDAELRLVEQANHMGFVERHDAYAPAIEDFCARCLALPRL